MSSNRDSIEIVEIKNSNNTNDSPLIALTEAICYGVQNLEMHGEPLNEAKLKGCRNAFRKIHLKILAPQSYWDYWNFPASAEIDRGKIQQEFQKILDHVNAVITEQGFDSELTFELTDITTG